MTCKTLPFFSDFIHALDSAIDMIICRNIIVDALRMACLAAGLSFCCPVLAPLRREIMACGAIQTWSLFFPSYRSVFPFAITMTIKADTALCRRIIDRGIAVHSSGVCGSFQSDPGCQPYKKQDDQPQRVSFYPDNIFQFFSL
jgi:hypothetical protein